MVGKQGNTSKGQEKVEGNKIEIVEREEIARLETIGSLYHL